jgi:aminopeptidase N
VTLSLHYKLSVPERAKPFGFTPHQINFGDWYPFIPAYRAGQGWLVHEPGTVGEHLVYDVADYQVNIRLVNSPANVVIATSAPAELIDGRRHYQLEAARNFAWSIGVDFQTISQTVGAVTVMGYVLPEHLEAGRAALQATAQAVKLYSDLFAPYPHQQLSFVEADFPDGMEYDGLYFLGREYFEGYQGHPQGYLTAIAVHETAHQWWYALVGSDQALEPWLDEALATYSELLFYEHAYPDLVAWWWQFRVKRFNPAGYVDSTIYEHEGFRSYVNAVYLRGALFLDEARRQMGDAAFLGFLREYATRYIGRTAAADDLFAVMRLHSPIAINQLKAPFFQQ